MIVDIIVRKNYSNIDFYTYIKIIEIKNTFVFYTNVYTYICFHFDLVDHSF